MYYTHFQNAGAIFVKTNYFFIEECYFKNNSNFQGGAIYFSELWIKDLQIFKIRKTIFTNNKAGLTGGSLHLSEGIKLIQGEIHSCYFLKELGDSRLQLFYLLSNLYFRCRGDSTTV